VILSRPLEVQPGAWLDSEATRVCISAWLAWGESTPRYPQFSGGQRQRLAIAHEPWQSTALIIGDEPVSRSMCRFRHKILNIFRELQGGCI
jgi:ABC-type dipeptide/oligopeptide/nickel transport system ATPase subunit